MVNLKRKRAILKKLVAQIKGTLVIQWYPFQLIVIVAIKNIEGYKDSIGKSLSATDCNIDDT